MVKEIKFGTPLGFNPNGGKITWWTNCFNGTFSNGKPISVMVNNGKSINGNSCHYIWSYPETVVWIKKDGSHGSDRVLTYTQIEGHEDIVFAIGGVGMSDFKPELEGFCEFEAENIFNHRIENKDFSDVLDETWHSVFGFKDDLFFASIMYGSGEDIALETKKMGMKHVVMGDGRSWAACNTESVKFQTEHVQHSLVQMTKVVPSPDLSYEEVVDKPVDKPKGQWNYFKYEEFANSMDGGANETKFELIDILDKVREITGSITVTSGFRTEAYNKSVGGSSNSNHLIGNAADITFDFNGWTVTSLKKLFSGFGFKNIGIYVRGNSFGWVHCDLGNKDFKRWNEGNGWKHYRDSAYKVYSV